MTKTTQKKKNKNKENKTKQKEKEEKTNEMKEKSRRRRRTRRSRRRRRYRGAFEQRLLHGQRRNALFRVKSLEFRGCEKTAARQSGALTMRWCDCSRDVAWPRRGRGRTLSYSFSLSRSLALSLTLSPSLALSLSLRQGLRCRPCGRHEFSVGRTTLSRR